MDYLVLMCVLFILVACAFNGYKSGAIKIAFALIASVLGVLLAMLFFEPFGDFLKENTQINEIVEDGIYDLIVEYMQSDELDKKADELTGDMLSEVPLPKQISEMLLKNNNEETVKQLGAESIADYISKELANMVIKVISFVILYILISLALRIIISLADAITKLPVVKEVNKLVGVVVGLLEGLVIVWIFFIVITGMTSTSEGQIIMEQIMDNAFLSFLYDNNLVLKILMSVL